MTDQEAPKSRRIQKVFFTGIFILVPMGITAWVLSILLANTQRIAGPLVRRFINTYFVIESTPRFVVPLVSLLLVFLFILFIGWLANFYFGKKILSLVDSLMLRLPFIRGIYGGTKQIIEAFSLQRNSGSFKKVVLLEYPRRSCWVLGFVTNENLAQSRSLYGRDLIGLFVPSTPNPTTGFLLYLEPSEIWVVDLEVEEAVKLIVSAGLVMPDLLRKKRPLTLVEDLGPEQAPTPSSPGEPVQAP